MQVGSQCVTASPPSRLFAAKQCLAGQGDDVALPYPAGRRLCRGQLGSHVGTQAATLAKQLQCGHGDLYLTAEYGQ